MGLGWTGAYGAQGIQDYLRQVAADKIAQQIRDRQAVVQDRDFDLRNRELQMQADRYKAQDAIAGQTRAQGLANQLVDEIPGNSSIAEPTAQAITEGGRGALVQRNAPQAMPGFLRMAGTEPDWNPGQQPGAVKLPTSAQSEKTKADEAGAEAKRQADLYKAGESERKFDEFKQQYDYQLKHPKQSDKLTKVEHKDEATGRTVIEWLPESEVRGKTFQKGTSATTESRLASAEAVSQTGDDMIAKLSDPTIAAQLGPVMGRYNTVQDFIGNPPPEFAELAGQIESYALANMGVHGMRSAEGAEKIKALLNAKHTPESLIGAIKGLNSFSAHFMQNEGRAPKPASGGSPKIKSITEVK